MVVNLRMALFLFLAAAAPALASEVAITIDDPETAKEPLYSATERNAKILAALTKHHVQALLFVCGKRVDSPAGKKLLAAWDLKNQLLGSHTYSHLDLDAPKTDLETYERDVLRGLPILDHYKNFVKFFRFPFLKEGETAEKRDGMRALLKEKGYRNGAVTIDTSDWAINDRLLKRLKIDKKADLSRYRVYYLAHIADRATYYDDLAKKVFGRDIEHTLLIHHSLLNALFLDDVLTQFEKKGWKFVTPTVAYQDPIFERPPNTLPAGESIVWAAAKESTKNSAGLRYPGESEAYERAGMDRFGL